MIYVHLYILHKCYEIVYKKKFGVGEKLRLQNVIPSTLQSTSGNFCYSSNCNICYDNANSKQRTVIQKKKKKFWHHHQSERIGRITNFHFVWFRRIFMPWLDRIWFRFHKIGLIILTNISVSCSSFYSFSEWDRTRRSNEISEKFGFLPSYTSGIFFLPLFWLSLWLSFQLIII